MSWFRRKVQEQVQMRLVISLSFVEGVMVRLRGWGITPSREVMATVVAVAQGLGLEVTAMTEATLEVATQNEEARYALEGIPIAEQMAASKIKQLEAEIEEAKDNLEMSKSQFTNLAKGAAARAEYLTGLVALLPPADSK